MGFELKDKLFNSYINKIIIIYYIILILRFNLLYLYIILFIIKIMEFTVKNNGLEIRVILKDPEIIEKYLKNSQEFEENVGIYIDSLVGYFHTPEEMRALIDEIDIEGLAKKINLLKTYENASLN